MLGTLNHQWVYLCWNMLGTLDHQSVCLSLLESCLELSTISVFASAGVMLGTLNHQWVYL